MPTYAYPYCSAPPPQPRIIPPPHYTPPSPTAWVPTLHRKKTLPKPTGPTRVPTPSHHIFTPPPRLISPSPHNMVPPTPQFAPPSPHIIPPHPHNIPPPPAPPHHTVIIVVFASLGGLFFLAFIAATLCCFIRKKKKMVHGDDMVNVTDHIHVHETVIPGQHGEKIVAMTNDEDINVQGTMKKKEFDVFDKALGIGVVTDHNGSNKKP